MSVDYTPAQKKAILKLCKQHIREHGNCRIGWAASEVLKSKQQNHVHQKLSALLIKSNKYSRQPSTMFANDYDVYINPAYWSNIRQSILIALFTSLLALITGYILWRLDNQEKRQSMEQVQQQLKDLKEKVDRLTK